MNWKKIGSIFVALSTLFSVSHAQTEQVNLAKAVEDFIRSRAALAIENNELLQFEINDIRNAFSSYSLFPGQTINVNFPDGTRIDFTPQGISFYGTESTTLSINPTSLQNGRIIELRETFNDQVQQTFNPLVAEEMLPIEIFTELQTKGAVTSCNLQAIYDTEFSLSVDGSGLVVNYTDLSYRLITDTPSGRYLIDFVSISNEVGEITDFDISLFDQNAQQSLITTELALPVGELPNAEGYFNIGGMCVPLSTPRSEQFLRAVGDKQGEEAAPEATEEGSIMILN